MSGVYWGLTGMHLLGRLHMMDEPAILEWVLSCQREDGGFGGSERHDSHLLYTQSALLILALYDALHRLDAERVLACEPPAVPFRSICCCPVLDGYLLKACATLCDRCAQLTTAGWILCW